ncbi:hypothetical protein M9435_002011 [Picochlorum sp. BPE23]|nr:hypothetical protein M9435_002011 [Picochlorum sp. BPE23]
MGMVLAGFLVAEMPIIRMALDEVFQEGSEPDWASPIPPDWIDGGGWGQERVLLFQNIPQLNQLEIVQVLYDVGIPPIIHSMSLDMVDDTSQILGHVLGQAVQLRRDFNDEEPYIDFEEDEEDEESEDEDAYMVTDDHSAPDLQPLDFGVIDDIWENNRGSSY